MASTKVSLVWLRRDLRLYDNHALFKALSGDYPVQLIFIFDTTILSRLTDSYDRRVDFIYQSLLDIEQTLSQKGSHLHIYHGDPVEIWPKILKNYNVQAVYFNHDYGPNPQKRDAAVQQILKEKSIPCSTFKDQCLFEKFDVVKDDKKPYTVYTPYKNKWLETYKKNPEERYESEKLFKNFYTGSKKIWQTLDDIGFKKTDLTFQRVNWETLQQTIKKYDKTRDYPGEDSGTTRMGIHLRFGTVSPRECLSYALQWNSVWLNELIWRDFFMQILFHFPYVVKSAFKPQYNAIEWRNNESEFKAWCEGRTGYPIVDAGMRELNATGYMHNRVRMITASFLVKNLLIDWRKGERYFASKLLDYDLSANNGNWQWVAGTGCDAAPYFRIFSPEQQTKKFDPELKYIKKWIPELHSKDYPKPIVDHKMARERTLKAYQKALK